MSGSMTTKHINAIAVLGAGTMGAQVALHCANAGLPTLLLDVTIEAARKGLDAARRLKPDPQFTPEVGAPNVPEPLRATVPA